MRLAATIVFAACAAALIPQSLSASPLSQLNATAGTTVGLLALSASTHAEFTAADPEASEFSGLAFADAEVTIAIKRLEENKAAEAVSSLTALIDSKELKDSARRDQLRAALGMIRIRSGEAAKTADDLKRLAQTTATSQKPDAVPTAAIARVLQRAVAAKSKANAGDLKEREAWQKLLTAVRADVAGEFKKNMDDLTKSISTEKRQAVKPAAAKSQDAFADLMAITIGQDESKTLSVESATSLAAVLEPLVEKLKKKQEKIATLNEELRQIGVERRKARDNGGDAQSFIPKQQAKKREHDEAKADHDSWKDSARPAFELYDQVQRRYRDELPLLTSKP